MDENKQNDAPRPAPPAKVTSSTEEWPKKVRTTIQPSVELEVGQAEYTDLSRQGLLIDEEK